MSFPQPTATTITVPEEVLDDLRERIAKTRWPVGADMGWDYGMDPKLLRIVLDHWASDYDWRATERRLNELDNFDWAGNHYIRAGEGAGLPIVLIHGWPGAVLEFERIIPMLVDAGHEVIVPSLPGFGFSVVPTMPLNSIGVAGWIRGLVEDALGIERYLVQGGDWGTLIAARIAYESPERVAGLHVNSPSVLPPPSSVADATEAEAAWLGEVNRWRDRGGLYLMMQSRVPDQLGPGLNDSPAGLAAWLVSKYRDWSDCDGEIFTRFSRDEICDFLTWYWVTESIASSIRLYGAEARDRWILEPGDGVRVPAAVSNFPKEILHPPREWAERTMLDLRSWTHHHHGGHFAAWEEPRRLADDLVAFAKTL